MSDGRPLDPRDDPDRFDPSRVSAGGSSEGSARGRTLPDLLGPGAHEDDRVGSQWLVGLLAVLAFLGLVAYLFARVLSPS